jgi:hypothetical protein
MQLVKLHWRLHTYKGRHFINNAVTFLLIDWTEYSFYWMTPFLLSISHRILSRNVRYHIFWILWCSKFGTETVSLVFVRVYCLTSFQARQYNRFKSRKFGRYCADLKKINWSVIRHFRRRGGVWFKCAKQFIIPSTIFKNFILRHPLFYHSL